MKNINFLSFIFILYSSFALSQTFANNTATISVDAVQRVAGCGFNTQPGVVMNVIAIPINGTIVDPSKITFNITLSATWLGDVVVELVSPQGEAITLIRRPGASSNSGCGDSSSFIPGNVLSFNSANTTPINVATPLFGEPIPPGNYAPTYGNSLFPLHHPGVMSTFLTGKTLSGDWRLYIYDYGVGEPSLINSWQMIIANGAVLKTSDAGIFGSDLSLKQNPAGDLLLLDIPKNYKSLNLEIFDASGKIVKSENILKNTNDVKLDVRSLPPGMYLLNPTMDGEKKQPLKFIKK